MTNEINAMNEGRISVPVVATFACIVNNSCIISRAQFDESVRLLFKSWLREKSQKMDNYSIENFGFSTHVFLQMSSRNFTL